MLRTLLLIFCILVLVITVLCIWKTGEYFNTLPESNQYKPVVAWDLILLFFVAVGLIMKIVTF